MKKRVFALLLGTVLAVGALAGCGGTPSDSTPTEDQQTTDDQQEAARRCRKPTPG